MSCRRMSENRSISSLYGPFRDRMPLDERLLFHVSELELPYLDLECFGHYLLRLGYRPVSVEDLYQAEDVCRSLRFGFWRLSLH